MAGLYIHIPFCKTRCTYCAFYSTTKYDSLGEKYVHALCKEYDIRKSHINENIETVYFGGGTPSILKPAQIELLLNKFDIANASEITLECNPNDIDNDFASSIASSGINRVSLGIQSFNNERLSYLRRTHTAEEAFEAIDILRRNNIGNISIDLMYGFPDETLEEWTKDIESAISLNVEHISSYCLTYEEGTVLHSRLKRNIIKEIDEETCRTMYYTLCDKLDAANFRHYEISNFAKEGYKSRHNLSYWTNKPYIGLGAAAHSYDGNCRQWNCSNVKSYIDSLEHDEIPCEKETLDIDSKFNDYVMLSLRTQEGISIEYIKDNFPPEYMDHLNKSCKKYLEIGLMDNIRSTNLAISRDGLFVSDMITADLFHT